MFTALKKHIVELFRVTYTVSKLEHQFTQAWKRYGFDRGLPKEMREIAFRDWMQTECLQGISADDFLRSVMIDLQR